MKLYFFWFFLIGLYTGITYAQTEKTQSTNADSLQKLGVSRYYAQDYEGSFASFTMAEALYVAQDSLNKAINSVLNISQLVERKTGSLDSVLKVLDRAQRYSMSLSETAYGTGLYYQRLGELLSRDGRYEDAQYYNKRSLEIIKKHPDHPKAIFEERGSYERLTSVEMNLFNYTKAETYAKMAIEYSKSHNIEHPFASAQLFYIYSITNRTDLADALIEEMDANNVLEQGRLFTTYDHYRDRISYFIGQNRFDEALEVAEDLNIKISASNYRNHFADWYYTQTVTNIYIGKKDYRKAIENIESINDDSDNSQRQPTTRAMDFHNLAYCHSKLNEMAKAESAIQTAINLHLPNELATSNFFDKVDYAQAYDKKLLIGILNMKAEIAVKQWEQTGNSSYEEIALHSYNQQHELIKKLGERSREDFFVGAIGYQKMYEDYFELLHKRWQKRPTEDLFYEVLTIADQSKNSAILSELKERKLETTFRSIPVELLKREQGLKKRLDTVSLTINAERRKQKLDSLESEFDRLKMELKRDFPKYYKLSYGSDMPLKEIIETNFSQASLTEFMVGENVIFVLNRNGGKFQFEKVTFDSELKNALKSYLASVRTPTDDSYKQVEEIIFDKLFKKYIDTSKANVVVLDDQLHLIPLSALISKTNLALANNEFSICRINTLAQFSESKGNLLDKALVMAPFAGGTDSGERTLSGSMAEAEYVQNQMGGVVKLNEEATKEAFVTEAADYAILHIATHSEVNLNSPFESTIYFSDSFSDVPSESQLRIQELYAMTLDSELVTLSSCETGLGQEIKGKGVQSISNAFSYAGVASTVMSLWKIPDAQTKEIMVSFYDNLSEGLPKDLALQRAKESYLVTAQDEALKHPYYWAGFVISGDPSPIESSTPFNWYVAIGALLLGLVGLGLLFRLKKKKLAS